MSENIEQKIYVACLAAYNNGYLHGKWIDVKDIDSVKNEIREMLAESPIPHAEEFAIHDYEGFGGMDIGEYTDIQTICEYAEFIQEYGEDLAGGVYSHYGCLKTAKEAIENAYHGEYESELEYAEQLFDECYAHDVPKNIRFYIDYEKFARDLFMCDYFSVSSNQGVHVFSCY